MVFKSNLSGRYQAGYGEFELVRYASKGLVVGGAGKLLKYFIRAAVLTESCLSQRSACSRGNFMKALVSCEKPRLLQATLTCIRGKCVRNHKSGFQLARLREKFPEVCGDGMTEEEICAAAGYFRCYDDGKVRWALTLD